MQKSSQQRYEGFFSPVPAPSSQGVYFGYDAPLPFKEIRKLHYHDRYEVGVCTRGKGVFICEGESKYLSRDDAIFIPPSVSHFSRSLSLQEPCSCKFVFVLPEVVERFLPSDTEKLSPNVPFVLPMELFPKECRDIKAIIDLEDSKLYQKEHIVAMRLALFMLEAQNTFVASEGKSRSIVSETDLVARYLSLNCDRDITLSELSEKFHISVSQLRRNFISSYGISPIAYKNRLRGNMAAQLLRRSEMTVGEIALRLGFPSGAELYRSFKNQYGISPGEYRKTKNNANKT